MKDERTEDELNQESEEWLEAFDEVIENHGKERTVRLLQQLQERSLFKGIKLPLPTNTPYLNTISAEEEPTYPGDRAIERKIKSLERWNAMAMVVRANALNPGIGGHISTFASAATLYQVGFNHFFRGKEHSSGGDHIYFQGHAAPGIYARAFLEHRLSENDLSNFRGELRKGGGLPSYPHPRLLPKFWEFPTVSMGLSAIMGIYQARFNRYLHNRSIKDTSGHDPGNRYDPRPMNALSRERND